MPPVKTEQPVKKNSMRFSIVHAFAACAYAAIAFASIRYANKHWEALLDIFVYLSCAIAATLAFHRRSTVCFACGAFIFAGLIIYNETWFYLFGHLIEWFRDEDDYSMSSIIGSHFQILCGVAGAIGVSFLTRTNASQAPPPVTADNNTPK